METGGCREGIEELNTLFFLSREAWTSHQQLAALYRRLVVTDLEFALDRKVAHLTAPYSFTRTSAIVQCVTNIIFRNIFGFVFLD